MAPSNRRFDANLHEFLLGVVQVQPAATRVTDAALAPSHHASQHRETEEVVVKSVEKEVTCISHQLLRFDDH